MGLKRPGGCWDPAMDDGELVPSKLAIFELASHRIYCGDRGSSKRCEGEHDGWSEGHQPGAAAQCNKSNLLDGCVTQYEASRIAKRGAG